MEGAGLLASPGRFKNVHGQSLFSVRNGTSQLPVVVPPTPLAAGGRSDFIALLYFSASSAIVLSKHPSAAPAAAAASPRFPGGFSKRTAPGIVPARALRKTSLRLPLDRRGRLPGPNGKPAGSRAAAVAGEVSVQSLCEQLEKISLERWESVRAIRATLAKTVKLVQEIQHQAGMEISPLSEEEQRAMQHLMLQTLE
ncbi:hypothetical protein JRQ81_008109 [Phrynocephalus forsythii]|uniref:Protein FAM33A n=1 Tax=Phrynocephalus forsythii TaxID=171643 RepID=A0A9Q0XDC1_9SAUR|nr:hypothetical protein JRQ81_008109 [Phrynocephalus forsythii]